jgi:hypothetical protein
MRRSLLFVAKPPRCTAVPAAIVVALLTAACGAGGSSTGSGSSDGSAPLPFSPSACIDSPLDIAAFLASCQPDDVKARISAALNDGSLASRHFMQVALNFQRCNTSCIGRVKTATASSLTIEAIVDGRDWTIGLSGGTVINRGGTRDAETIPASDLRKGEVVHALSQDGASAQWVRSLSQ